MLDVSRGGALMACDWRLAAGTALEIDAPKAGGAVSGRVVRSEAGSMGVIFNSDPANLARADVLFNALVRMRVAA
jgi:hypothetical protein